jgi:hypothetical protein
MIHPFFQKNTNPSPQRRFAQKTKMPGRNALPFPPGEKTLKEKEFSKYINMNRDKLVGNRFMGKSLQKI